MSYIKHRSDESREDYLETILILQQKNGHVRSIDIVNEMELTKPSVSVAMKNLRECGLITMDESNYVWLTEEGKKYAESVYERHQILSGMLVALGVDKKVAAEDACRMEHDISEETFAAIKKHYQTYK